MLDFIQQLVNGIALGCVYGLIALGFVLIYKATEVVNFAQGELLMMGGFFAFTFITFMGLNYWIRSFPSSWPRSGWASSPAPSPA
jgi:branched-chain amino acid transport system permease protein